MCQHLEDFFEKLTFSSEFHQFQWVGSFPLALSFFFIFAKWRSCLLSFWVFRAMLTVADRERENAMQGKASAPGAFKWNHPSDEIFKAATWVWTMYQGFHWLSCAVAFVAVYPLAPLCSFHFYHLWSSNGQRTPGFMSTKVLLLQIVNPRPVCSNDFPAVHSFFTFLPYSLSVCIYWGWGCGAAEGEGKWMHRFTFASCSLWLV